MTLKGMAVLTCATFLAASGQIFFKIGADRRSEILEFVNFQIFTGLFLYGASTALWIYALSFERLSVVYAFTALTFVLVYLSAALLLGENITFKAALGVLFILTGLLFVATSPTA